MNQLCFNKKEKKKKDLGSDSLVAQLVKNPPEMQETPIRSLSWEDLLEKRMATHSSILAWRILLDRGAWQDTMHRVAKRRTRLK